jgi:eukaryotic-like serine/threonine-protein kinase
MTDVIERLGAALAGRYTIVRELGRGGMATVFLARDLRHGRMVAIKVLRPDLAIAIGPERFLREIQIAAGLSHPNILSIFDSGQADGMLYYVMPYIEGETLRHRLLRERQLPVGEAVRIVREIAEGLGHAHRHGLVHRDIKPENILLHEGHAVIGDFGLARAIADSRGDRLTETGMAIGTPQYMSPEQASGERDLDQRTDLYSLGCVLFELLTGEPPFGGPNAAAITAKKLSAAIPSIRMVRETVPAGLERVARKALARAPADRYATAAALVEDLVAAAGEETRPVTAGSTKAGSTVVGVARSFRRRSAAWILAGLVLITSAVWGAAHLLAGRDDQIESVAVLPLENLMHDDAQDYFVEGMHQSLIASLSRIPSLRVISRTSVMALKRPTLSLPTIGARLGVDGIVEGSVLRSGGRVRITVTLLRAHPERELWTRTYDREMSDVLDLHREVAQDVAQQLEVTLAPSDTLRLATSRARLNPAAQEAYFKGRYHWQQQTQPEVEQAIKFFEQALQADSTHAPAYAGLADCYILLSWAGSDPLPAAEAYPRAKSAALRALQLDSSLAEAHTSLGLIHWRYDWDWAGAEREFRNALALNPNAAEAEHWYGLFLATRGRQEEAIAAMRRAATLDPLSLLISVNTGWVLYLGRRYEAAVRQETSTVRLWPSFGPVHYHLGLAYEQMKRYPEAIAELERARALSGDLPYLLATLGHVYAVAGRADDARRQLRALERNRDLAPSLAALIYTGMGDKTRALDWLEKAFDQRDAYLAFLKVNPVWDPLRGEARFRRLLDRL